MKTKITLFVFAATISLSLSVNAQNSSHRVVNIDIPDKELALTPGIPFTINAYNLGENGVLCVNRSEKAQSAKMKAFTIVYNENRKAMVEWQRIEKIAPLPEDALTFQSNTLSVKGSPSVQKRVVIWLSVPADTQLIVSSDGYFINSAPIVSNVMIQNGKIIDQPPGYNLQAAVMQAIALKPRHK